VFYLVLTLYEALSETVVAIAGSLGSKQDAACLIAERVEMFKKGEPLRNREQRERERDREREPERDRGKIDSGHDR
jgi:hypothetical protein